MKTKLIILVALLVLFILVVIYGRWFNFPEIIGGDWPYFFRGTLADAQWYPYLWAPWQGNGLGGVNPLLGLLFFQSTLVVPFVRWGGLPWVLVYKLGWFGLFILLAIVSSWRLSRTVWPLQRWPWQGLLGVLIFLTNTYVLMLVGGGQMGVALAYAIAPLVLSQFVKIVGSQPKSLRLFLATGVGLGIQILFDPRIAYVTMIGVGLYYLVIIIQDPRSWQKIWWSLIIPLSAASLLNAFWLLPLLALRHNPLAQLGGAYTSVGALKFFSFADFSHALSLLHPNWPENLFGKTYFLQPEFLIWPLLAFAVLISKKTSMLVRYFALLALVGAFLAKGANPPGGVVFVWLYSHFPGFVMFRDPTKFYLLTVISYSVLIPEALRQFAETIATAVKPKIGFMSEINILVISVMVFSLGWIFSIRQALLGQLDGTFRRHNVPQEYRELSEFLRNQPGFFRTLWVPRQSRFSYATLNHMASEAGPLFQATDSAGLIRAFTSSGLLNRLNELGVKYIIIPYDSLGEIFLEDRKYDEKQPRLLEKDMDTITWLKKLQSGPITVYETPVHRDLFWLDSGGKVSYAMVNPGRYQLRVTLTKPSTLYFSQSFHSGWVARDSRTIMPSQKTPVGLNSFKLREPGEYSLIVYFAPQRYVDYGVIVSAVTLGGLSVLLLRRRLF